ncbi:hypothetical protein CL634_11330 [bacterium]|nr:hypothetical protein [bacterium]|tara:strand:+ start:1019 stop:1609 length:591 start_codon:yes stop_codon:yes gene_type:complete
MNKFRLAISRGKVLSVDEVDEKTERSHFASFASLQDLTNFLHSKQLKLNKNSKAGVSYTDSGELNEFALVNADHEDPVEYFFDSEEEYIEFTKRQGLQPSVHLLPEEDRKQISKFFSGEECSFDGYKELYDAYQKEIERSGGENCPECFRNGVMRKYQDMILSDSEQAIKELADTRPQSEKIKERNKQKNKKTKKK